MADVTLRFRAPARLDDALLIVSRVQSVSAARVVIHQTVRRDRHVLTQGTVTVALVGSDGRPRRQPRAWTDIYQSLIWQGDIEHP